MNISNLTKAASALLLVVVLSIVGYYGYHYRRENQAKEAWHTLEKSLGHSPTIDAKIEAYKKFIKTWDSTHSSANACYLAGKLEMEKDETNYANAIKDLTMANFTKGSILDTERHLCLAVCYERTNKPQKALEMYDHIITHAPSYAPKMQALWATAEIYEKGSLKDKKKQKKFLEQITQIPLDGIKTDESSTKIRDAAVVKLTLLNLQEQAA